MGSGSNGGRARDTSNLPQEGATLYNAPMSWYRLYRPQRVADLEIAPVREHFLKVLQSGQYGHAYLFAGPRGTGKTSTARILARVLNDSANASAVTTMTGPLVEPNPDDILLQRIAQGRAQVVIEQDAASHRGIDDIRQLQEEVSVVPTEGSIRVVILDEVHMLTAEAFNALLKLLEEPPQRVVFILATTELHKVPATIQSRCQLIQFRLATREELQNVLQKVIKAEKLTVDPIALEGIITAANGSFRDAVKWLEQVAANGQVTVEAVTAIVGSTQIIQNLLRSLAQKDLATLQTTFASLRQSGASFSALETLLLQALHERLTRAMTRKESPATVQNILQLLEFLVTRLTGGPEPWDGLRLEVACYRWAVGEGAVLTTDSEGAAGPSEVSPKVATKKSQPSESSAPAATTQACLVEPVAEKRQSLSEASKSVGAASITQEAVQSKWEAILLTLRTQSTAVEALMRTARLAGVQGDTIEICLARVFHQERLSTPKYLTMLQEAFAQHFPGQITLSFTVAPIDPDEFTPAASGPDDLSAIVDSLVAGL